MADDTSQGAETKRGEEEKPKSGRFADLRSLINRRTFMKASAVLGVGAAVGQSDHTNVIGSVAAEEHGTFDVSQNFVRLNSSVFGGLYEPTEETARSHIAFVFIHPSADFSTGWRNEIAERHGYRALGVDSHISRAHSLGNQLNQTHIHDVMFDINDAVSYVRDIPEVRYVILGGHSGGAHLMSLYQNIAENGVEIGQGDEKIYPLPDELGEEELPPGDGVILIDGHTGYAAKALIDLGPQLVNPNNPNERRTDVDYLEPQNGFNPEPGEPSNYDDEFVQRFNQAQADRMNQLIDENVQTVQEIENFPEGDARFPDDENFVLLDTRSRIFRPDPSILGTTQDEHPVHHAEDSEVAEDRIEIKRPTRREESEPRSPDYEPPLEYHEWEVEPISTNIFLSSRAIRPTEDYLLSEDSIEGVDWQSANAQTPGNLETVSAPLLITPTTGHYFVTQGEVFYNHAGTNDKELRYIEGGTHGFTPIDPKYGDTRTVVFNVWDNWVRERFC